VIAEKYTAKVTTRKERSMKERRESGGEELGSEHERNGYQRPSIIVRLLLKPLELYVLGNQMAFSTARVRPPHASLLPLPAPGVDPPRVARPGTRLARALSEAPRTSGWPALAAARRPQASTARAGDWDGVAARLGLPANAMRA
jgi:hypothetical protein